MVKSLPFKFIVKYCGKLLEFLTKLYKFLHFFRFFHKDIYEKQQIYCKLIPEWQTNNLDKLNFFFFEI